jgi:hypothetical protein
MALRLGVVTDWAPDLRVVRKYGKDRRCALSFGGDDAVLSTLMAHTRKGSLEWRSAPCVRV